jgi:hypothetical protein
MTYFYLHFGIGALAAAVLLCLELWISFLEGHYLRHWDHVQYVLAAIFAVTILGPVGALAVAAYLFCLFFL